MNKHTVISRLKNSADCRVCFAIVGFVYMPLVLLVGAGAVIGLG